MPLFEGYECNIKGKRVGLEAQIDAKFVPRIIGLMTDDGPCNDDVDLETPVVSDEYVEGQSAIMAPPISTATGIEASTDTPDIPDTQKKFVPPTNFYGKPSTTGEKIAKPL